MIKKLLSLSKNLFTETAFLPFAFRSKGRVNKSHLLPVKKKNAGRIPETTRIENPLKRHPPTHRTKRAFTNL